MNETELYERTKHGVEQKLMKRNRTKKKIMVTSLICGLLVCVNISAYASSQNYRNWLAKQLGIKTEKTVEVKKTSTTDNGINMEVLSYYRAENIVVLSLSLSRNDGTVFLEEANMENVNIFGEKNKAELLCTDNYLSEDKKSILFMMTVRTNDNKIRIEAKNLISRVNGENLYKGEWQLSVDVSKQTGEIEKIADTELIKVDIFEKKYTIKELYHVANTLIFKCDVKKRKASPEESLSSVHGGLVEIEYKDGSKSSEDYYCSPDNEGNLMVQVWDYDELEDIAQVYVDGHKLFR